MKWLDGLRLLKGALEAVIASTISITSSMAKVLKYIDIALLVRTLGI